MGRSSLSPEDLQRLLPVMGMVQEDLAVEFKVRQPTVSRWLSGQVPIPGYVEAWLRAAHPEALAKIKGGQSQ